MNEQLETVAKAIIDLGYKIHVSWVDDNTLKIVGPENRMISISRDNLSEINVEGLSNRLEDIFKAMKPGYTCAKKTF